MRKPEVADRLSHDCARFDSCRSCGGIAIAGRNKFRTSTAQVYNENSGQLLPIHAHYIEPFVCFILETIGCGVPPMHLATLGHAKSISRRHYNLAIWDNPHDLRGISLSLSDLACMLLRFRSLDGDFCPRSRAFSSVILNRSPMLPAASFRTGQRSLRASQQLHDSRYANGSLDLVCRRSETTLLRLS